MILAERLSSKYKYYLPNETVKDTLFLLLIISLSRILFIFQLGFYSDDWSFLEMLFFNKMNIWENYRPGYLLSWKFIYSLFGFSATGYHLINTLIFYLNALLLYLILRKLSLPRLFALTIPLVFMLLPHYSTFHFWASVIPNHFCLVMCLGSLLLDLKALETPFPKFLYWKLISIVAIVSSVLTYELFLPFFYFNMLITFYYYRKLKIHQPKDIIVNFKKVLWLAAFNFVIIKVSLVYKLFFTITSERMMGSGTSFIEHMSGLLVNIFRLNYDEYDYGFNIIQSLKINFVEYGIELPEKMIQIYNHYPNLQVFYLSLLLTFTIFGYLFTIVKKFDFGNFKKSSFIKMMFVGLIIFFLGYSIFLTNYSMAFSTTGIANRVSIGASIGIVILFVGLITGISALIKSIKLRNIFFTSLVAFICVSGLIINNTIATFWKEAYEAENKTIEEIKNNFTSLPKNTKVILDGLCPYIGPAIVFESNWDIGGILRIAYSDTTLQGDVVSPDLQINEKGFVTSIYEVEYFYPYDILIYNLNERKVYNISSKEEAIKYLETANSNYNENCPYGHEAHGVKIFN